MAFTLTLLIIVITVLSFLTNLTWHNYANYREKYNSPLPLNTMIVLMLIICSMGVVADGINTAQKESYKQGQIDYMNGVIKYKAVPTTQINYENVEK